MNNIKEKTDLPRFGGALFSDSIKKQPSGKVDLTGVFTIFNSWAFPCIRSWQMTLTIYNSPTEGAVDVGIRKIGERNIKPLALIQFTKQSGKGRTDRIFTSPLTNEFSRDGGYEVICSLKNTNLQIKNPIYIKHLEWPEFSTSEINAATNLRSKAITKINVQLNCPSCNHIYVFEESLLENEEPTGGALSFPKDGNFKCNKCDHDFNLKDLQGQIRYNIKDNLNRLMKTNV